MLFRAPLVHEHSFDLLPTFDEDNPALAPGTVRPGPWANLRGGVLLGNEEFVARMESHLSEKQSATEIPRRYLLF